MAEPPVKRARRVDSSTMWDMDDRRTRSPDLETDFDRNLRREPYDDAERRGGGSRDDRRYRSRSRDRRERRRDRSRSRDRRDRDRDRRDRERDGRDIRPNDRSPSRERYYDRVHPSKGDRYRDRSRSPIRNGNRDRVSPPRGSRGDRRNDRRDNRGQANGMSESKRLSANRSKDDMDVDMDDVGGDDGIEEMMRKSMGFSNFRSTKNTKVPGNNVYGVRKEKKTEYRQYMNRIGGFNRPLSPSR